MSGYTNAEERRLLDLHTAGGYIGLVSAIADDEAGTVTEMDGDEYVRLPYADHMDVYDTGGTNDANPLVIRWDALDSALAKTVAGIGLWSALSGGTLRHVKALTGGNVAVAANQPFEVAANQYIVGLD